MTWMKYSKFNFKCARYCHRGTLTITQQIVQFIAVFIIKCTWKTTHVYWYISISITCLTESKPMFNTCGCHAMLIRPLYLPQPLSHLLGYFDREKHGRRTVSPSHCCRNDEPWPSRLYWDHRKNIIRIRLNVNLI